MKHRRFLLSLNLLLLAACSRQPAFETTITAYEISNPTAESNLEPGSDSASRPQQVSLRWIFHSDEFWEFFGTQNPTVKPREIEKIKQGLNASPLQFTKQGSVHKVDYTITLQRGDQATFQSLLASYRIFQRTQADQQIHAVNQTKADTKARIDEANFSLSLLKPKPTDSTSEVTQLERKIQIYRARIQYWDAEITELGIAGKLVEE